MPTATGTTAKQSCNNIKENITNKGKATISVDPCKRRVTKEHRYM